MIRQLGWNERGVFAAEGLRHSSLWGAPSFFASFARVELHISPTVPEDRRFRLSRFELVFRKKVYGFLDGYPTSS